MSKKRFKIEVEPLIQVGEDIRKPAFTNVNRHVDDLSVKNIRKDITQYGYYDGEEIQVLKAESEKCSKLTLTDIHGDNILVEDRDQYYAIMDGQHRVHAVALHNSEIEFDESRHLKVPAKLVELNNQTYTERLNAINRLKKPWGTNDYIVGASNLNPENKLLTFYKENIKENNNNGYPRSVLNMIFTSSRDSIKRKDFIDLCAGKTKKSRGNKDIIPAFNLEAGLEFINTCKEIGFKDKHINKRYIIENFLDLNKVTGSHKDSIAILKTLNPDDIAELLTDSERINEDKLIEKFRELREDYLKSKAS